MNENINFSKPKGDLEDDKDYSSTSTTIYEDDNDLTYFSKSGKGRALNSSLSKRSPLSIINKSNQASGSSACSSHHMEQPAKTPSKLDEIFVKRLQPKEPMVDPFQFVSDEILLHIFSYLPKKALTRIALVNDRFNRVQQDETLWVRMDLGNKPLKRGAISKLLCRGLVILRLAQAKIQSPIFEPDFNPVGFVSKLQYLDLSMASIDTESLTQLLHACGNLKKLSVEFVPLNMSVCHEIGLNMGLEVLNMAMCEGITKSALAYILQMCPNLTALNIAWINLSCDGCSTLAENLTPNIVRLNMAGCRKTLMDKRKFKLF